MTTQSTTEWVWRSVLGAIATLVIFAVAPPPARATFPGQNGRIAYRSAVDPNTPTARNAIFLTDAGQLTFPRGDSFPPDLDGDPAWSPGGTQVAFTRTDQLLGDYLIEIVGKDGTGLRQVISSDAFDQAPPPGHEISRIYGPAWTADGERISFVHRNSGLPALEGIWTVRTDGTGLTQTIPGSVVNWPNWSKENKMVYACRFRFRNNNPSFPMDDLCVYDASTGAVRQVPIDLPNTMMFRVNTQELIPKWSPDGQKIVFSFSFSFSERNHLADYSEIFTVNADGTELTEITFSADACPNQNVNTSSTTSAHSPAEMFYRGPAYSPDGQLIVAFAAKTVATGVANTSTNECSYGGSDVGLWTLKAEEGLPSLLVADRYAAQPDWQLLLDGLTLHIDDGHGKPLKGLKVALHSLDGTVVHDHPVNTVGGIYVFEDGALAPGDYVVRATLVDHAGSPGAQPAFDIRYAPTPSEPVWLESRFTIASTGEAHVIHFAKANCDPNDQQCSLLGYGPVPSDAGDRLDDMANIYFRVRQYVDWVKTHLTADTGETVEFYTFVSADPWGKSVDLNVLKAYYDPSHTAVVFGIAMSAYERRDGVANAVGIDDDAPENGEWHEFTHHLYWTFVTNRGLATAACAGNYTPHGGYNNPDTCDSLNEGFATFLPTLAAQAIDGVADATYDGFGGSNLEVNHKAWGQWNQLDTTREEFAVAALFWDLVDTNADTEDTQVIGEDQLHHPVAYTDAVSIPLKQLWDQLTSAHPATVFELRLSFGTPGLTVDLDGDGVADIAPIDAVFLMHGFFPVHNDQTITDAHKTYHYDVGYAQQSTPSDRRNGSVSVSSHRVFDAAGTVTDTLVPRFKTPLAPNANLEIHVVDASGTPVSGPTVYMTIRYPGLEETVSRRLRSGDGALVHLELPAYFDYLLPTGAALPACDPAHDVHVEVSVRAMVNGVASDTYAFDNCAYLQAVHAATGPAALSLTLTVPIHAGGTPEVCDGMDNDLNGLIDEGVLNTYYRDADGDTYGNPAVTTQACTPPPGYVTAHTDCNDSNAAIHPGATEVCNGIDDNCNGQVDEGLPTTTYYRDADNDTYGNASVTTQACVQPAGYVSNNTDCHDGNASVHPGAPEICGNSLDDNCDGQVDEGCSGAYNFGGFFQPIDNPPTLNAVKAGSSLPVKFSLGGNQGLNIFALGSPGSQTIVCDSAAVVDAIEETVTAGGSSLSYDSTTNQYLYVWKTDKTWAGTCRQLVVQFNDGTLRRANFKLTK